MILGYRVKKGALYATGAATWTRDRRRAFLFTSRQPQRVPFDDARTWASAHADELRKKSGRRIRLVRVTKPGD